MLASGTEINNFATTKENYVVVSAPGQVDLQRCSQRFTGRSLDQTLKCQRTFLPIHSSLI